MTLQKSSHTVNPVRYYPVNLDLKGRPVVVIGGGEVAIRKIQGLLEAGARVKVVDPDSVAEVRQLARQGKITLVRRRYRTGDLGSAFAAIASTDDRAVNLKIHDEASKKKILLNIVDKPEFCSFVFPSRINRGEFMLTISTGGASPAFARMVREELEERFGEEYGLMADLMSHLRRVLPKGEETGRRFSRFVRSSALSCLRRRDWPGVDRLLKRHFGDRLSVRSLGMGRTL